MLRTNHNVVRIIVTIVVEACSVPSNCRAKGLCRPTFDADEMIHSP